MLKIDPEDPRFVKGYKPLNTYTYDYWACVTSGFPETERRFAGLKITCETDFVIYSETRAFLKIRNPILYEVNGTSQYCKSRYGGSLKISPVSEELAPLLERPIEFEYKEGKVGKIYCSDEEPEYILNIKRGILSILHHNFTKPELSIDDKEPRMYKNWEFGSHGMCENLYDVRYIPETKTIKEMQVSKILNMKNCTGKPRVFSNVPGVRCLNNSCNIDEPLKISVSSSCDLLGSEDNFVVKKCNVEGKYIFTPTQMKGSGMTLTKQYVTFKEVKAESESYEVGGDIPRTLEMTYYDEEDKPLTEKERSEIAMKTEKMMDSLVKSVEQKEWKAWKFTALVETLRKVDKQTLLEMWEHCYNDDKHRQWFLEALPYVYKEEVFELIAEKIYTRDLEPKLAVPVLRGLALTTNATEKMCQDISDLCSRAAVQEDEALKMTCYLTSGALMHEYCKKKDHTCLTDKATELKNRLLTAKYQEKMFILKAIGNFGHKTLYKPLLDIIQDHKNTLELRVTAVYALRRIAPKVPQKVLPVLLQIFRQPLIDTELRMACFVIMCDCKPGPAVFNLITKQLFYERTNQVRSFVVSYIKGMAFSKYPCDERMASTARVALRMLRKYKLSFLSSKWLHFGEYSELLQMGGSVDLQMISTPSSIIPRALNTKVKMQVLGKSLNLFETGVRGEGIQELLQRVVGPRGHYSKEKSLFGLLRPRRSLNKNLNGKELKEIQKLLPITEYEEEKAKGSFYFKVLGKELIYNYFTYDDVKELIEDGVIRVNNDLKDMLKKGKNWNMTKVFVPVEVKFYQPSCVGLPLKFSLESVLFLRVNTTVKAEVQPKFFIPLPDQVTVSGKINVSVLHSTWGKMKVCLPQLETGCKMKMKINMTTSLGGSLQCKLKDQSYTTELDVPKERQEIFSTEKQGYTFLMYTKPVKPEMKDWSSLYRSSKLDGFEIGDVSDIGRKHHHRYANWTLKAGSGKYLSVNEQNELILSEEPTVFKVFFVGMNRQFVKLFVTGKGFVKVKPDSNGCLESVQDERYPKLFKITYPKRSLRNIRLATVVFIHPNKSKNPEEWMGATAPMNTDQVLLFKHMIEDIKPTDGYEEKWRYVSDLPLDDVPVQERFHPRHMKIEFVTPVEGKVCLRPNKSYETMFTVHRHYSNTSELCYGERMLGLDVCLSGQYIEPLMPHAPVFPFCGPTKYNVSIKPGQNPTQKIQFTFGKGDRFDEQYHTWKAGMKLVGTNPEKKIETDIKYDVDNKKTDFTIDMYNMYPWLRKVCINSHVITSQEIRFNLSFGEDCEDYKFQSRIAIKEPGRRELSWVTSYNKIPDTLLKLCYKLLKEFTRQYYDRFSDYRRGQIQRNKVDFTVKFRTEELVDLEVKTPTCLLKMDNVQFETDGFIPRGSNYHSTLMHMLAVAAPVCTVDHDSFKTFDDVEFQYSLPGHCTHVLAKDCTKNNVFMVLMSKETEIPDNKVIEIFVEREKIRIEHLVEGRYQIQVNGEIVDMPKNSYRLKNVATIFVEPEKEELHVSCDAGLEVEMVRGTKIDVRVSPYFFNRTCGMCGDCNAEWYRDLKTPMGKEYTSRDRLKYGNMWMVPEETCLTGGCHFKKQHVLESKTIEEQNYNCYPTTPVLRCLDECKATKTKMTLFPMTCVKTGSGESAKIFKNIEKRTLDLTGSEVFYKQNLREDIECDCSVCGRSLNGS